MKVATAAQMREIDERTIRDYNIPSEALMLEAGRAVARELSQRFSPSRVVLVCGKGNNAGDGFVVAHELNCGGVEVDVLCMEPTDNYAGAAANALARLSGTRVGITAFDERAAELLVKAEVVVDALLGTGIRGTLSDRYAAAALAINQSKRLVVSIDVPSGLGETTLADNDVTVRATLTVSIGLPKLSMFSPMGLQSTGELVVSHIQFPRELLEDEKLQVTWLPLEDLQGWLPRRTLDANKGTFGNVGIVAGSAPYAGAAILVARAALRAGCGLASIACPSGLNSIYKSALPEATSVIVPSRDGSSFDGTSAEQIIVKAERFSALAIGPGIGTGPDQSELLLQLLENLQKPIVLDADALTLIADSEQLRTSFSHLPDCILTPHPGEMARLLGCTVGDVQNDRIAAARNAAKTYGVAVLLKGAGTLISLPDGDTYVVRGGTAALAKGGTGDVLTGAIAALVAQGLPCWKAGVIAASAHAEAGKRCALKYGERGVLASEVADEIPRVFDSWPNVKTED